MRFMSGLERSRHKASWGEGEVNKRTFISSVSGKNASCLSKKSIAESLQSNFSTSPASPRLKSQSRIFQKGRRILGDIAKEMRLILHSDAEPFKQVTALEQRENQAAKTGRKQKTDWDLNYFGRYIQPNSSQCSAFCPLTQ